MNWMTDMMWVLTTWPDVHDVCIVMLTEMAHDRGRQWTVTEVESDPGLLWLPTSRFISWLCVQCTDTPMVVAS